MSALAVVMKEKGIESDDLDALASNTVWLVRRYDRLRKEYPNEYVAVNRNRVVDHDRDMLSLLQRLKSKHGKVDHFAIEFVTKEDFDLILPT